MDLGPEILNDFLTESGELLDQLETDLVVLERSATDLDLINRVFRSLHTIKGSASFLSLTNLVEIAHAAETALNAARNGQAAIDAAAMNLLLAAVDTVKVQMGQIAAGEADLAKPDATVVSGLLAMGSNADSHAHDAHAAPTPAPTPASASTSTPATVPAAAAATPAKPRKLEFSAEKQVLVEYLDSELDEAHAAISQCVSTLRPGNAGSKEAGDLRDVASALQKTLDFFALEPLATAAGLFVRFADAWTDLSEQDGPQAAGLVRAVLEDFALAAAFVHRREVPPAGPFASHNQLSAFLTSGSVDTSEAPRPALTPANTPAPTPASSIAPRAASTQEAKPAAATAARDESKPANAAAKDAPKEGNAVRHAEQTIRVDVERLESLMNLVGELVLQKNRIGALVRRAAGDKRIDRELVEAFATSSGGIDRVTGDIQVAVMRTRMQPLEKLFGKYPRLVRDLSQKLAKKIELVVEGGETEVDKSVIEELGDPLIHLMRNAADHGIEGPEERAKAGKGEVGRITLAAAHRGSYVVIQVRDDGRGLSRDRIGKKAVERGLCTEAELAAMSDRDVLRFIFAAGFSTAEQVSDVSGRGVGMDVVRANVEKIKGEIELSSEVGRGSTVSIRIPLTVAIMQAMMVSIGNEIMAVPLESILEIVRPLPEQVSTIQGSRVMRLRNMVLPLMHGPEAFDIPNADGVAAPFAVVLHSAERHAGLMVTRLIGQQEIVVKRLSEVCEGGGPVSGATVRDDGGVSLIIDVPELIRRTQRAEQAMSA